MKNRKYFTLVLAACFVFLSLNTAYGQCDQAGNAQALNTQSSWVLSYGEAKKQKLGDGIQTYFDRNAESFSAAAKGFVYAEYYCRQNGLRKKFS